MRFTPEQLASAAAAGQPCSEESFGGDTAAWHAYQDGFFSTLTLGETLPPVGDGNRAKRWKAVRRQHGKIEAQRSKDAADAAVLAQQDGNAEAGRRMSKRLKVSERWQEEHAAGIQQLTASTPHASPGGQHATRELRATVATPGGNGAREHVTEVQYSLPPLAGESESAEKRRHDRHRRREQLALERLSVANEKEAAAQTAEAEAERAKAEAVMKQQQAEQERLLRKGGVVRDGNTIYQHETFVRVDPTSHRTPFGRSSSWTPFDQRDLRVYYPDGSSCDVRPPAAGQRRDPWRLVQPWTHRAGVLPPIVCGWATLDELRQISVAMIAMGGLVHSGSAAGWRDQHLSMAVCACKSCIYRNDCVTFQPPGQPRSPSEFSRLGITWGVGPAAWKPLHVPLGQSSCWPHGNVPRRVADAVAAAFLPSAEQPPRRTAFTPIALQARLPPSIAFMQEGDVVLWNGVPHFVYRIGADTAGLGESEILFRTAAMHGRERGLANPPHPAFLSRVAEQLEPPRMEHIAWAQSTAAAAKAGEPSETLPPPPPPPPIWRRVVRHEPEGWWGAAADAGLPTSVRHLKIADVVTFKGQPYFVQEVNARYAGSDVVLVLRDPQGYAVPAFGEQPMRLTFRPTEPIRPPEDPELLARWPTPPEVLAEEEYFKRAREEQREVLRLHLALADEETAEEARAAADAALARAPPPVAPSAASEAVFQELTLPLYGVHNTATSTTTASASAPLCTDEHETPPEVATDDDESESDDNSDECCDWGFF